MLRWVTERSRHFWLSLACGVLTAAVALPSFTDPWPANAGGLLGHAFLEGWREPPGRAAG